jgi:NADH:ubiquinone oxidoreductase subunit 3 (subunit A)
MENFWSSPPMALVIFLALAYGLYRIGGALAVRGEHSVNKHLPYTGGEDPLPVPSVLTYHAFFRLALLFGILHVATLVLSTLPRHIPSHRLALVYLAGVGISVLVLTGEEEE